MHTVGLVCVCLCVVYLTNLKETECLAAVSEHKRAVTYWAWLEAADGLPRVFMEKLLIYYVFSAGFLIVFLIDSVIDASDLWFWGI